MYVYFPLPNHRQWFNQVMDLLEVHGTEYDTLIFICRALRNALTNSHEDGEELANMLSTEFTAGPYRILVDRQLEEEDVGGVQNWFWNRIELASEDLARHFEDYLAPRGNFPRCRYSFISLEESSICFYVESGHAPSCIY